MPKHTRRLLARTVATAPTVGYDEVVFDRVPMGEQWHVEWAAVEDDTSTQAEYAIVVRASGADYIVAYNYLETATDTYARHLELVLAENEQLVIRVYDATADDVLVGFLVGYTLEHGPD